MGTTRKWLEQLFEFSYVISKVNGWISDKFFENNIAVIF
jgi:hypothetical protein